MRSRLPNPSYESLQVGDRVFVSKDIVPFDKCTGKATVSRKTRDMVYLKPDGSSREIAVRDFSNVFVLSSIERDFTGWLSNPHNQPAPSPVTPSPTPSPTSPISPSSSPSGQGNQHARTPGILIFTDDILAEKKESERNRRRSSGSQTATPEGAGTTPEGTGTTPEGAGATPEGTGPTPEGTGATSEGTGATPEGTGAIPEGTGETVRRTKKNLWNTLLETFKRKPKTGNETPSTPNTETQESTEIGPFSWRTSQEELTRYLKRDYELFAEKKDKERQTHRQKIVSLGKQSLSDEQVEFYATNARHYLYEDGNDFPRNDTNERWSPQGTYALSDVDAQRVGDATEIHIQNFLQSRSAVSETVGGSFFSLPTVSANKEEV